MFMQNFKIYNIACGSTYITIFSLKTEEEIIKRAPTYHNIFILNKISTEKDTVPNELYDRFIYKV